MEYLRFHFLRLFHDVCLWWNHETKFIHQWRKSFKLVIFLWDKCRLWCLFTSLVTPTHSFLTNIIILLMTSFFFSGNMREKKNKDPDMSLGGRQVSSLCLYSVCLIIHWALKFLRLRCKHVVVEFYCSYCTWNALSDLPHLFITDLNQRKSKEWPSGCSLRNVCKVDETDISWNNIWNRLWCGLSFNQTVAALRASEEGEYLWNSHDNVLRYSSHVLSLPRVPLVHEAFMSLSPTYCDKIFSCLSVWISTEQEKTLNVKRMREDYSLLFQSLCYHHVRDKSCKYTDKRVFTPHGLTST